jgi:predicted amidophosphoribosyltransferase
MGIGLGKTVVSVLCGFREILGFVFSKNCIGCDVENQKAKHFLCADCKADIGFIRQPFCFQCGVPGELSYAFPH